jgi:hypothetical protein
MAVLVLRGRYSIDKWGSRNPPERNRAPTYLPFLAKFVAIRDPFLRCYEWRFQGQSLVARRQGTLVSAGRALVSYYGDVASTSLVVPDHHVK